MDKKIVEIIQAVEEIARRVCREEQQINNERIRTITRYECENILRERDKAESVRAGEMDYLGRYYTKERVS